MMVLIVFFFPLEALQAIEALQAMQALQAWQVSVCWGTREKKRRTLRTSRHVHNSSPSEVCSPTSQQQWSRICPAVDVLLVGKREVTPVRARPAPFTPTPVDHLPQHNQPQQLAPRKTRVRFKAAWTQQAEPTCKTCDTCV